MTMIIRRFYELPSESNPFSELNRMRSEMESLFGRLAESLPTGYGPGVFPLINITEDHDRLYVRAELPGVNRVEANYTNGILTVTLPKAELSKPKQISVKAA
jgi:HSP20 family protein